MSRDQFAAVLREHAGLLARIAASYEADPSLRDDLLQDIALALWRALPAWRGEAALKTFVARVAHNRGATHVLGQRRLPRSDAAGDELPDLRLGPEEHARLSQDLGRLQQAVRALPLALRQAVTLALEGFSHAEIAAALGASANSIAVRLSRARVALKSLLGEVP